MKLKGITDKGYKRIATSMSLDVIINSLNEYAEEYAQDVTKSIPLTGLAKEVAEIVYNSGRMEELHPYAQMAIERYYPEEEI